MNFRRIPVAASSVARGAAATGCASTARGASLDLGEETALVMEWPRVLKLHVRPPEHGVLAHGEGLTGDTGSEKHGGDAAVFQHFLEGTAGGHTE